MLKKVMKVLLIILVSVIILAALLFGFAKTYTYIRDWKYNQEVLQIPKYDAYRNELLRKNINIIRIDIYYIDSDYALGEHQKSINKYQLIGTITDDNDQLNEFKKVFKKIISSKIHKREITAFSDIWLNVLYKDGTNAVAEIIHGRNGVIRIYNYITDEVPGKNNHISIRFQMQDQLWQIIKENMTLEYKKAKI